MAFSATDEEGGAICMTVEAYLAKLKANPPGPRSDNSGKNRNGKGKEGGSGSRTTSSIPPPLSPRQIGRAHV